MVKATSCIKLVKALAKWRENCQIHLIYIFQSECVPKKKSQNTATVQEHTAYKFVTRKISSQFTFSMVIFLFA